jgi:hypothetical protein
MEAPLAWLQQLLNASVMRAHAVIKFCGPNIGLVSINLIRPPSKAVDFMVMVESLSAAGAEANVRRGQHGAYVEYSVTALARRAR